jgi:hypothetical protein
MLDAEDGLRERVGHLRVCPYVKVLWTHTYLEDGQVGQFSPWTPSLQVGHLPGGAWNFHPNNPKSPVELAHGRKNGRG